MVFRKVLQKRVAFRSLHLDFRWLRLLPHHRLNLGEHSYLKVAAIEPAKWGTTFSNWEQMPGVLPFGKLLYVHMHWHHAICNWHFSHFCNFRGQIASFIRSKRNGKHAQHIDRIPFSGEASGLMAVFCCTIAFCLSYLGGAFLDPSIAVKRSRF